MPVDARRVKELFGAALDIPETAARDAYLDRECGDDNELRQRLNALLQAHESPASAVMQPLAGEGTVAYAPSEKPGTLVASRYKLLEPIGEGGMGTVWVAEQTEPVRRKVAIKLIKAGMDSRSVLARFEAERQALAMMDHPNIAKVLDAGLTEERRPYFVMEYIKGLPLTKYCDDVKLSIDERLKVFIQICQAVQHAHQKGIIHRDLKPTNILIALYDGKPVPKVIDFGLAKALHHSLTERTLHTGHEMVLGTPLYMSPEQAELNNLDIDTRSDIYSLGVILYELLTGVTPLEKQRFKEAAWMEILRIIKEEEPSKPSTKLSHSASLPSVAAQRQMEPKKLSSLMKGDLDWIVMKALEKDRNRRYETANGFAADVLRYLSGEAVTAVPPSAGYRLKKFVKRHKGQVIAAGLLLTTLVAGLFATSYGFYRADRERERANAAERNAVDNAIKAMDAAEAERKAKQQAETEKASALKAAEAEKAANTQAQKRLTQIEKTNEILGSIFENLDPREFAKTERPLQVILVEKLDKTVAQLEGESIGDPLAVATMQVKFGRSLLGLGEPGKAIVLLEKACATRRAKLGSEHPETLISVSNLASAYQAAGKLELALPLLEETLQLRKANLGYDHPDTLGSMNALGSIYWRIWKMDKALPLFEETLKLRRAKLGLDHPDTLSSMNALAIGYHNTAKLDQAQQLYEEALKLRKAKLGTDHPDTLSSLNNLAEVYKDQGKPDLALPLYQEVFNRGTAKLGPDHPSTLLYMINLVESYRSVGKPNLSMAEEAFKRTRTKMGTDHYMTFESMDNLGSVYLAMGKLDLALPLFEETLKLRQAKIGSTHKHTLYSMGHLAVAYQAAGKLDQALPLLEETLIIAKSTLGPDAAWTIMCMHNLGEGFRALGKLEMALPLLLQAATDIEKQKFAHRFGEQIIGNLISLYEQLKQYDLAETWRQKGLAVVKERYGQESIIYAIELAGLGRNLLNQRKYSEAEPMLLASYQKIKQQAQNLNKYESRLSEALDCLIQFYTVTNKPDEVKKWQAEKEKLPKSSTAKP